MRLRKMVLCGYKRFMLSGIQKFTYTPEALEQVILGSNGSGKSSVLEEIIRLVPDGKDFVKGGFKEYHFEHNDHVFELLSTYNVRAGAHYFTMDGVQLNDGNTQATQRELVATHVGLDDELIDLILGRVRFSKLSPAQRREWLMRISGTDFEYALGLHTFFKEKATDLRGALGYLIEHTAKMAGEISSLEEDYKTQDLEIEKLKEVIDQTTTILTREGRKNSTESLVKRMYASHATVRQKAETILAETVRRPKAMWGKEAYEVERDLDECKARVMMISGECNEHEKQLESVRSLIKHVGRETLDNPSGLEAEMRALSDEIEDLKTQGTEYACHDESAERLLAVAESVQERLAELCTAIPANNDNTYTRGGHTTNVERVRALEQGILERRNIASKLEAQLEHANHTAETNCPKCKTSFKPGWDADLLVRMQAKVDQLHREEGEMRKEIEELSVHIDDFNAYSAQIGELGQIRASSKSLKSFWDRVTEQQHIKLCPAQIPVMLAKDIATLKNLVRLERLTKDLQERHSRLELIRNSGDPKYLLTRADMLENQLFEKSNQSMELIGQIGTINEEIYHLQKLDTLTNEMHAALAEYQVLEEEVQAAIEHDCLSTIKDMSLARLGVLHQQTQRYRDLMARYADNNEQLREVESKFEAYKQITRALSPVEGIIAEAVKSFIGHFVGMLNDHVGMVWNYDMEIAAVVEDGASLTCKFPFYVGSSDQEVADVGMGSTGQVSMIDFAFKLVVMELLDLTDYPLLADEFGKDFDDEHRERLVNYIQSLMEQKRFSQLFMVSHYSSVYGAFNQAEFVVLDDRNITKPSRYNEQVEIQ